MHVGPEDEGLHTVTVREGQKLRVSLWDLIFQYACFTITWGLDIRANRISTFVFFQVKQLKSVDRK